ncbi:MAG TPA: XrtA/PEP-CTERM system histidine kinase PrsK [Verrucomicrobiae bacterium]|nr:XrtA/PEP-CTERM system histidine kinase PrsK [Verrucomicrobiae bacterium]
MSSADMLGLASAFFSGFLALIAVWKERRSTAVWTFVAGVAALAAEDLCWSLTTDAATPDEMMRWQTWRLMAKSLLPGLWLLFSLSYARGNAAEFRKRWRWILTGAFVLPVGLVWLPDGYFGPLIASANQLETGEWRFILGPRGVALNLCFLLAAVLILMNLERTYRAAIGTMLWRIKFMILGLGVIFAVRLYVSIQTLLFHNSLGLSLEAVAATATLVGDVLILRSLFRTGHFHADVYPALSAPQPPLTVILTGIYLLLVGVFANVVAFFGGSAAFTLKAFVLLVLLVAAAVVLMSDRARLYARRFLSRHFQRPLYDYRSVWRRFTSETAARATAAELCQAAVKLLSEIFQSLSVTIWLVDDKRENFVFATSTFLSEAKANSLKPSSVEAAAAIDALEKNSDPVDLDASTEGWTAALRRCHPDQFRKGGHRVCVPMVSGGEVHGVILLGDRVGGAGFSWQEFDLLKCVADQLAASLLTLQLSQRVLQAREMEAFQTMSAFFVHDLKNTASTLNLMLKNLPEHFHDPEFRADALRGIANTVAHINRLISRLSQLRHELQIKPAEGDLNEVVLQALAGWEDAAGVRLVKKLEPLPRLPLDREQMLKVVTNLVLNAREAVLPSGEVRIETFRTNGWAVLTVSDNGCGMTPEFIHRCLFRPFQTTKKNGLGIGLFQSKMIVEAHKGRVQVESQPGKGTTFRILLPLAKPGEASGH